MDDTTLVVNSEEKMCQLVEEFRRVCGRRNLRANENKSKLIKCIMGLGGRRMNVALSGKLFEEVECFKYYGPKNIVDGGIETEVKPRINDVRKVLGGMKMVFSCRAMGMNVKRRLYGVTVPTAVYGTGTWSMAVSEKKRLNVMEMRCLRSMFGVMHMVQVRTEEI